MALTPTLRTNMVGSRCHGHSGWTPLWRAAGNGHEAIVKLLLEKGADPNPKDKDGRTPLMGW